MRVILVILAVGAVLTASSVSWATPSITLYVSPSGAADGDGTRARPFGRLEEARDAIRAMKEGAALPEGGVAVALLPGRYAVSTPFELTAADAGSGSAPIIYRSAERGKTTLTGAVPIVSWQSVSNPVTRELLSDKARDHVVWAALPSGVPTPVPGFANGGCGYRGKPQYPVALFQDETRLPIARWPNGALARMGACVGHHQKRGHVGTTYTEGRFIFESDRLERWNREPDPWLDGLWFHHWADQKMQIEEIALETRTIALAQPESHAFGYKTGQHFFAFNMIGEIDRPGEWAVDRDARRIYLWPTADPNRKPVVAAATDHLVTLEGVADLHFEGLVFEGCRDTAIVARKCTGLRLRGCTLRHLGSWGVSIDGGRDCAVVGCDLYDLGEGGIKASGGVRNTLDPGNHLIENNHIHHFGRIVSTYKPGAAIYGVGNRIRHNLIYQAQHQAIFFRGNDHLIEYNIVHDVCLHSSDAGAIYSCARDWSRRGTIIRHNLFHALGEGLDGAGCRAIYLDDMSSGTIVHSNIVTMADRGLNFGGGKDLVVSSNIAVNCKESLNLASRGIDSFARKNAEKGRDSTQFKLLLRDEALFRGKLWQTRYPNLLAALEMDPVDAQNAHHNTIRGNVNIGGGKLTISNARKVMRTCTVADNIDLMRDPGFVDLSALDLRLRDGAPIYKQLPDFEAPDFQRMGLYADSRRASSMVKFGADVTPLSPIMSPAERSRAELPVLIPVVGLSGPIAINGVVNPSEWEDGSTSGPHALTATMGEDDADPPARLWIRADHAHLFVAFRHPGGAAGSAPGGQTWGQDDGVEIVLAPAHDERLPNRLEGLILRGYANGTLNVAETSRPLEPKQREGVCYATCPAPPGSWSAELKVPFSAIGVSATEGNLPIYCHVTVRRASSNQWISWRRRWSLDPGDAKCATALWLQPLGPIAFMPGHPAPAIRIDVQGKRPSETTSMQAGAGASAPDWAVKWNRLVTTFGTARGDRWKACHFEFMPLEDATVSLELMGTQTRPGNPTAWTYYDAFEVEGAELVNGDFEEGGEQSRIPGWECVFDHRGEAVARGEAGVVLLDSGAASGRRAARTSHDHRVNQSIRITKGQKVTVRFQARAALPRATE